MQKNNSGQTRHGVPERNFERQNYYFGKLLKKQDFEAEQSYMNEKRWLLNRLCHGWGVVCGLKVVPCPGEAGKVIVQPGLALDNYGNEIVVTEPQKVDLVQACGAACEKNKYYVTIKYFECQTQPSPIPVEDCGEYKTDCVYERTREFFKIEVTCDEPEWPEKTNQKTNCNENPLRACVNILSNPAQFVIEGCSERERCEPLVLACVCYVEGCHIAEDDIDNFSYRNIALSNEMLFELICHLTEEHQQMYAAKPDRRQHVPLLASTIKGVIPQDGKLARTYTDFCKHPHRCTSDGDYIWMTDHESGKITRINRYTNKIVEDPVVELSNHSWGIAYDGARMWISHHETIPGQLTWVKVCDLTCETESKFTDCKALVECEKRTKDQPPAETIELRAHPQEIVYHAGHIYVAHGRGIGPAEKVEQKTPVEQQADYEQHEKAQVVQPIYISRIDPIKCCFVEEIAIKPTQYSTPITPVIAMVSDGDALWVTYEAVSQRGGSEAVLRKIEDENGKSNLSDPVDLKIKIGRPERMIFDGTHLWISHYDGVIKFNILTEKVDAINTKAGQTALAFGGSEYLWSVENRRNELAINRIDIHSEELIEWLEIEDYHDKPNANYENTDMQFDGTYIYVIGHYNEGSSAKKGLIHRLLP